MVNNVAMEKEHGFIRRHWKFFTALGVVTAIAAGTVVDNVNDLHDSSNLGPLPAETPEADFGTNSFICFEEIPNCDDTTGYFAKLFSGTNVVPTTLEKIDDDFENALIDKEDQRFREHDGVDDPSIVRAILHNSLASIKEGSIVFKEGASTIEMQLARNLYLADLPEGEWERKKWEAKQALKLNRDHTKDWILQKYFNTINFGRGAYGIEAAAWVYLGKSAEDATFVEAATVIAAAEGPDQREGSLDPARNAAQLEKLTIGRDIAIKAMYDNGDITKQEYEDFKNGVNPQKDINTYLLPYHRFPKNPTIDYSIADTIGARHNLDKVLEQVKATIVANGFDESYLYKDLRINTTLSFPLQVATKAAIEGNNFPRDGRQIVAIVLAQDGGTLSEYAGDYNYSQINMVEVAGPVGSQLKLLAWLNAFKIGQVTSLDQTYPLQPIDFNTYPADTDIIWPGGDNGQDWAPRGGQLCRDLETWNIAKAIALSCNDAVLQVALDNPNSLTEIDQLLKDFYAPSAQETPQPSWILGQAGLSPKAMATLFNGIIGNRGMSVPPRRINEITAKEGDSYNQKIDYRAELAESYPSVQVVPPENADLIIEAGRQVVRNGTAAKHLGGLAADTSGKTGTETDNRTAGFTGTVHTDNGNVTIAVKYGFVDRLAPLGDGEHGGDRPAEVFGQIATTIGSPNGSING